MIGKLVRRVWPDRRRVMLTVAAVALFWVTGDSRRAVEAARQKPRAWFDAKGAFVFPLGGGQLPDTRQQLQESLFRGWSRHLRLPDPDAAVQTHGGRYPAIGSLYINLAGASVKDEGEAHREPPLKPTGKVERRVAVRDFRLDADELEMEKAHIDIHVSAVDARLDMQRDEKGRPMVMLADAKTAAFHFQASNKDIERILVSDLNELTQRYQVTVARADLKLTAENNRSIDLDLHLSTRVAFLPAGLRFTAHVDIDNDMYARLSHLKCEGDEALGPLIVGLIRPGLKKYEGKSRLVFSFPTGQLRLRDVKIQGGEQVKVYAEFER